MKRTTGDILFFFIILFSCHVSGLSAKSAGQMFITMPDSLMPYAGADSRKELIELNKIEGDSTSSVATALGRMSLTKMTDDLLVVKLSNEVAFEIGRLSPTLFAVVKTMSIPEEESTCRIYDQNWQMVGVYGPSIDSLFCGEQLLRDSIAAMAEFPLIEMHLDFSSERVNAESTTESGIILSVKVNAPMLTEEEQKRWSRLSLQRNLKWNGKIFN